MPLYQFTCKNCGSEFEALAAYDASGNYPGVICPHCESIDKAKLPSRFAFSFKNPEGTDLWNNSHDYRFNTKLPKARAERASAEASSHMGTRPYTEKDDIDAYDSGVHDPK